MVLRDILAARCPKCRQGAIFTSLWRMNSHCPHCHIKFEREEGFFIMSIYMAYAVNILLVSPILVGGYLRGMSINWILGISLGVMSLFAPLSVRFTRALWLYLDEWLDPRPKDK